MSRSIPLRSICIGLGLLALPVGALAQVSPQSPDRRLPESALQARSKDAKSYTFQRSLHAVAERARLAREARERAGSPGKATTGTAVSGNYSIPVLLVRFANTPADPYSPVELEDALFSTAPDSLTLRAYYLEQSQGQLNVGGQVFGWAPLSQNDTYYEGSTNGLTPGDARTGELILETLLLQDAAIDFGLYDNDGPDGIPNSGDDDGYVDFVAFVHPEAGGECGNGGTNLWSHRWRYSAWPASSGLPFATNDPSANGGTILVDDYVLQPGLRCGGGGRIEIGVFCHEFGHAFGLPDLYDINGGGGQGLGHWDLMASGNWNLPTSPAHMSAWTKQQLGWVQTIPVDWASTTLNLAPVEIVPSIYEVRIDRERWRRVVDCPISGSASLAVGVDAAESSARGWAASAGYGNGWVETVAHDFHSDGSSSVQLDFDYRSDTEAGFDFAFALVEVNTIETMLAVYDGSASGHASFDLSAALGPGPVDFRVKFRFRSDAAYSNEDGNYASVCRPFVVDDVRVVGGGLDHLADFESHRGGWYSPQNEIDNPNSESWLLENRQGTGFDAMLHGRGLMVYHLDREVLTTALGNSGGASETATRGLVVEEADGNFDLLDLISSNRGDAGDPWPGSAAATAFDSTTTPAATDNAGRPTTFSLTQIVASGDSVRCVVGGGSWPPAMSGVVPDSAGLDSTFLRLSLAGAARIRHGATLRLVPTQGTSILSSATQWLDEDRVSFDFDLSGAREGVYDVVVENPDGQSAVVPGGLRLGASSATTTGDGPGSTRRLRLGQNYPNPFNPRTTILFELPRAGAVRLAVYDLRGRELRRLLDRSLSAGEHRVVFDGLDDHGRRLASGLYFYRLMSDAGSRQQKMLLIR